MRIDTLALPFKRIAERTQSVQDLIEAMADITIRLGLHHFALANHVDVARTPGAIRLHNYPACWAELYDRKGFVYLDPVHRRSHLTNEGFAWSGMNRIEPMSRLERQIMALGADHGIGEGFTVPVHLPGEAATCTFVNITGDPIAPAIQALAQLAGTAGFCAARRLFRQSGGRNPALRPALTPQQIAVVQRMAQGKSDRQIAEDLHIAEETAATHVRDIYCRYGVNKRPHLIYLAVKDGYII